MTASCRPGLGCGALGHLEASIVDGFRCEVRACERLGVTHDGDDREHIHIGGRTRGRAAGAEGLRQLAGAVGDVGDVGDATESSAGAPAP